MGSGRYSSHDWDSYSTSRGYDFKTPEEVINRDRVNPDFLPINFKNGRREARDSADNPRSTPLIVAGDVTGSMGHVAGELIKDGLSRLAPMIYDRRPISDPAIMGMALGDAMCRPADRYPIQCTQFESDIRINQQFEQLMVEGGGGSNKGESYDLPWLVAAFMCESDAWDLRKEKGVLFTYGDEPAPQGLSREAQQRVLGRATEADLPARSALALARERWDVYHLLLVNEGYCRYGRDAIETWRSLMPDTLIFVEDYHKLPEVIVGVLEATRKGTISDFDNADTSRMVGAATAKLLTSGR